MPASLKRTRKYMKVEELKDGGVSLTIRVAAYPNGIVSVNGVPMPEGNRWPGAFESVVITLREFSRLVNKRKFPTGA